MGHPWPPCHFIFCLFQTNITIFTTNKFRKMSIQHADSNSRPSEHESAPITTRPGYPFTLSYCRVVPTSRCSLILQFLKQKSSFISWMFSSKKKTFWPIRSFPFFAYKRSLSFAVNESWALSTRSPFFHKEIFGDIS